ncbi:MAG: DMT family transporter [Spirulina sp. SIO3F2]|nr:DMT family transporter [Spirulina sp. SIO3F2]
MNESVSPSSQRLIWGGLLALFSALMLSLQNVTISIILNATSLFNTWEIGGYLRPNFGNSLLIFMLRMVIAVPLMFQLAPLLHPKTLPEIRAFLKLTNRRSIVQICVCSLMLFAASLLIYIALGGVTPGIALILFFGGALLSTVLGATVVLKEPSSAWLWGALVMIFFGISAIALPNSSSIRLSGFGLLTALLSIRFGIWGLHPPYPCLYPKAAPCFL